LSRLVKTRASLRVPTAVELQKAIKTWRQRCVDARSLLWQMPLMMR
jgi:hypothetical protein